MKKILIITYYWPPAGGPGVQRWLKFVKYLPEFGFEPIVYCPENPSYPIVDQSLLNEVSNSVTVLKQPIKEPYRFANLLSGNKAKTISSGIIPKKKKQSFVQRALLYIRGNFFIPDARKFWVRPSVSYLSNYIRENGIETIITTGPPHSLHLIGLKLKETLDLKWFADFRDPWTTIGYHKQLKLTKTSAETHRKLEQQVLQSADHIIVTSQNTKSEFSTKTEKPITVITNGYDIKTTAKSLKNEKFTLAHIGSLLSERNPKQLWQAIAELIDEHSDFKESFQLNLVGVVSEDIIQTLKESGLSKYTNTLGYLSHQDAVAAQMSASVLLLVEIDSEDTKVIIPGKLFEYMAAERPILAIGPTATDVEIILKETNTGKYFYYNQKAKLKAQLLSYFKDFKNDKLEVNAIGLEKYSRKALTEKLAELF